MKPVYEDDAFRFEALKIGFVNKTEYLRTLVQKDLTLFSGYITLQLILAGWIASNPLPGTWLKVGIFLIDLTLAIIVAMLMYKNDIRRAISVEDLANFSDALGFSVKGAYLEGMALQSRPKKRSSFWWYIGAIAVTVISVAIVIFAAQERPSMTSLPVSTIEVPAMEEEKQE